MAKQAAPRPKGRLIGWALAVALVFFLGAMAGSGTTAQKRVNDYHQHVVACLPAQDQVQLDGCLSR